MSEKIVFNLNKPSPTFIASADIHLGKKLYNFPELEEDLRDNFVRLVELAIEKDVRYLIIAGDLFEDNNYTKPHTIAFIAKLVAKLALHDIKLIGIAGDHDKPLKGEAWIRISDILPVTIEPSFTGLDYFDYSYVTVDELVTALTGDKNPENIKWIFLHCQFPQLFKMAEPKKLIDFNKLELFKNFPNLQGIIAGDIHSGPETKAYGVNREAYVGYTGSLGITDIAESRTVKSVLYCDGKNLIRLPFQQRRAWKEINFQGEAAVNFDVSAELEWINKEKFKPVLKINWDNNSDPYINKLTALYEAALVKLQQHPIGSLTNDECEEVLTSRSDITTDVKIEKALHSCCDGDEDLYTLSLSLLNNDVKDTLDQFKAKYEL
jgi:hypothetical protein